MLTPKQTAVIRHPAHRSILQCFPAPVYKFATIGEEGSLVAQVLALEFFRKVSAKNRLVVFLNARTELEEIAARIPKELARTFAVADFSERERVCSIDLLAAQHDDGRLKALNDFCEIATTHDEQLRISQETRRFLLYVDQLLQPAGRRRGRPYSLLEVLDSALCPPKVVHELTMYDVPKEYRFTDTSFTHPSSKVRTELDALIASLQFSEHFTRHSQILRRDTVSRGLGQHNLFVVLPERAAPSKLIVRNVLRRFREQLIADGDETARCRVIATSYAGQTKDDFDHQMQYFFVPGLFSAVGGHTGVDDVVPELYTRLAKTQQGQIHLGKQGEQIELRNSDMAYDADPLLTINRSKWAADKNPKLGELMQNLVQIRYTRAAKEVDDHLVNTISNRSLLPWTAWSRWETLHKNGQEFEVPPPADLAPYLTAGDQKSEKKICEAEALVASGELRIPKTKLKELDQQLQKKVIGQKAAVATAARVVKMATLGLKVNPRRPHGVLLFLGPTGTGKTELAKAMAQEIFGDADRMVRFDMSEFQEKHTTSKIIGAPAGYMGYEDGGNLTQAIAKNPHSVILLDEIEKAHKNVTQLFLQLFDEGRLTDGKGKTVSFHDTYIVMTSNIGNDLSDKLGHDDAGEASIISEEDIIKELKKHFSPEFIGRIDEICFFKKLNDAELLQVVELKLQQALASLTARGFPVYLRAGVAACIRDQAIRQSGREFATRNVIRQINRLLLEPIADMALTAESEEVIVVDVDPENTALTFAYAGLEIQREYEQFLQKLPTCKQKYAALLLTGKCSDLQNLQVQLETLLDDKCDDLIRKELRKRRAEERKLRKLAGITDAVASVAIAKPAPESVRTVKSVRQKVLELKQKELFIQLAREVAESRQLLTDVETLVSLPTIYATVA